MHAGHWPDATPPTWSSGSQLPHLGVATASSSVVSQAYLVAHPETPIAPQPVKLVSGETRYLFDQLANPESAVFKPGGLWRAQILLHGGFGTASESQASQLLMKAFATAIRSHFRRIKAFWVGAGAERMLDSGARLTIAEQSPREFDLTRHDPEAS
ncbi:MAG TPA: hypothetical protein VMK12_11500 [Anaeromyxobacteraceae bacterium]|nr:hypothetical protein [Anaeromyxobacteraceae bacterium]